jgi:hypothetical protein
MQPDSWALNAIARVFYAFVARDLGREIRDL